MDVNPAICELLGYPHDELTKKTFADVTHPEDLEADLDAVRRTIAGEQSAYSMVKRYLTRDGRIVWIRLTAIPVKLDGEFKGFVSWIAPLPNGGDFKVDKQTDGTVTVRPTIAMTDLIGDNWRWFVALGLLACGLITKDQLLSILKLVF